LIQRLHIELARSGVGLSNYAFSATDKSLIKSGVTAVGQTATVTASYHQSALYKIEGKLMFTMSRRSAGGYAKSTVTAIGYDQYLLTITSIGCKLKSHSLTPCWDSPSLR